jgi:hypothetical protein
MRLGNVATTAEEWKSGRKKSVAEHLVNSPQITRVLLHEGEDSTGIWGAYRCHTELTPGRTVAIPSGVTYLINRVVQGQTSGSGEPYRHTAIYCKRPEVAANSIGMIRLSI